VEFWQSFSSDGMGELVARFEPEAEPESGSDGGDQWQRLRNKPGWMTEHAERWSRSDIAG